MTESDWWACQEPWVMLAFLRGSGKLSERKARLFAVACVRRVWNLLTEEASRMAIEVAQRHADGQATDDELAEAHLAAWDAVKDADHDEAVTAASVDAADAAYGACFEDAFDAAADASESLLRAAEDDSEDSTAQAILLRDILGPLPFRSVTLPPSAWTWNDGCVVQLATGISEDRDFSQERMGVLADALEEAGVTDAEMLRHLRGPGPHCHGCWCVDFLLGRE
jgi:hypothetical protein